MIYITHTKFRGKDLQGKKVMISRGKKLERIGDLLYFENHPICIYRSECAKMHFSINDDFKGMIRGDITHKIAYSDSKISINKSGHRFSENQVELLTSDKWKKFLNPDHNVILFSDSFFDADVEELQTLYNELISITDN